MIESGQSGRDYGRKDQAITVTADEGRASDVDRTTDHPVRTRKSSSRRIQSVTYRVAGLLVVLMAWDLSVRFGVFTELILPAPLTVFKTLIELVSDGTLAEHAFASLRRVGGGFGIAVVLGVIIGVATGLVRGLRLSILPLVELVRPISPIAWIPLAILWFGIGDGPSWFVIFLASFFPIVTNTYIGVTSVPIDKLRAARMCGVNGFALVWKVILPASLAYISSGVRVGLGIGWMAVIAAEYIAAQSGLGYYIEVSRETFQTDGVISGMIAIGILGAFINMLLEKLTGWLTPWAKKPGDV